MMMQKSMVRTYATWDPANKAANVSLSGGGLVASIATTGTQASCVAATVGKSSGLWYWEETMTSAAGLYGMSGLARAGSAIASLPYPGAEASLLSLGYYGGDGGLYYNSTGPNASLGTYVSGDVLGFTLDAAAGTCKIYKNNVLKGTTPALGGSGLIYPATGGAGGTQTISKTANFGATAFAYPSRPATDGANAGLWV